MKKIWLILVLLWAGHSYAQSCTTATCTASSCSEASVLAALPSSSNTNSTVTVNIPACSAGTEWTSGFSYSPPAAVTTLNIIGSGMPNSGSSTTGASSSCGNTYILDSGGSSNPLIWLKPTYPQVVRLSCLNLDPASSSTGLISPIFAIGTCTSSGCPSLRIDNITFGKNTQWTESGNGSAADWLIRADNMFGVIDHNTIPTNSNVELLNANHSAYLGVGAYGDNSWAAPDSFGTANNLFMENNNIYVSGQAVNDCDTSDSVTDIGGCRIVGRYNTINANGAFSAFYVHGTDTDQRARGGRQIEAYNNKLLCSSSSGCNAGMVTYRSGTGYVWGNTMSVSNSGFYNNIAQIVVYRTVFTNTPFGACGGAGPWDTNDGTVYYSGSNSGASGSTTLTDTSKNWSTNQLVPSGAPYSVYDISQGWWAEIASNTSNTLTIQASIPEQVNTFKSGDSYEIIRSTICIDQGGRGTGKSIAGSTPTATGALSQAQDPIYEWMNTASSVFHGNIQSDTGRTIANRDWYTDNSAGQQTTPTSPFNGSSGMGWGTLANRPTSCSVQVGYWATDQNTLYLCKTANAWSVGYQPYTYPHPLDSNSTASAQSPGAPTNLQGTVM